MCCKSSVDIMLWSQLSPIIPGNNDAIIRKPSHCIVVSKCALVNGFAILTANELHHVNSKPSILGFGDRAMLGSHEVFEKNGD